MSETRMPVTSVAFVMGVEDRNRSKRLVTRLDGLLRGEPHVAIRQLSHGRTARITDERSDGSLLRKLPA
jgi:hypothetical protein